MTDAEASEKGTLTCTRKLNFCLLYFCFVSSRPWAWRSHKLFHLRKVGETAWHDTEATNLLGPGSLSETNPLIICVCDLQLVFVCLSAI